MIIDYDNTSPTLGDNVFIAQSATVIGNVALGQSSSIWYGSVLRGDVGQIHIGARSNIQDLSVIHVTTDLYDTWVGDDVTVGHRVILHGCKIENKCLIGMGAIILDGAVIGEGSLIGAGSLITPRTQIPAGSLVMGSPGRVVRQLNAKERAEIEFSAKHYVDIAQKHKIKTN